MRRLQFRASSCYASSAIDAGASGGVRGFDFASRTFSGIRGRTLTQAITVNAKTGNGWLKIAAGGVVTGLLTPLLPPLIDKINGSPGDFRIALDLDLTSFLYPVWQAGVAVTLAMALRWSRIS